MHGRCYYSLRDLCSITGMTEYSLKKAIREKKLKTEKLMRSYRVTLSDFKNFLDHKKFKEFYHDHYLTEEKLFRIAGVPEKEWKNTLLLQSPSWKYVMVYTQKSDAEGDIVKVGFDSVGKLQSKTITSKQFVSMIRSNQFTKISKYQ